MPTTHPFDGVRYYLPETWPEDRRRQLVHSLDEGGAEESPLDEATHVIAKSQVFEGYKTISEDAVHIVSDTWVDKCSLYGEHRPEKYYSLDPKNIFSGVVACATELSPADVETVSAAITAMGGQWRIGLVKDVTHLFANSPGTQKYNTAMQYKPTTGIKVVVPNWFDDSQRLGMAGLPTEEYEYPETRVTRPMLEDPNKSGKPTTQAKKLLYKAQIQKPEDVKASGRNVWHNKRILLSTSLELVGTRREGVEANITRSHGIVVRYQKNKGDGTKAEELALVESADILVTRFRKGSAYFKAMREHKTVGTLSWLHYVMASGTISSPTDQLMHFPVPKSEIPEFTRHKISVSNYTGESRDYLKKLITAMGGEFTPAMTGKNTVLVAAYKQGSKVLKAANWSIPVVNHTWLEDCFHDWRALTVGLEKYIVFPPGVDFSQLLGQRGITLSTITVDEEIGDSEEEIEEVRPVKRKSSVRPSKTINAGPPSSRNPASVLDAREVEDALTMQLASEEDVQMADPDGMDVDDQQPSRSRSRRRAPSISTPKRTRSVSRKEAEDEENDRRSRTRRTRSETRRDAENDAGPSKPRGRANRPVSASSRASRARSASTTKGAPMDQDTDEEVEAPAPARGRTGRKVHKKTTSTVAETPRTLNSSRKRRSSPAPDEEMIDVDAPVVIKGKVKENTAPVTPTKALRTKAKVDVRATRNQTPENSATESEEESKPSPKRPKSRTTTKQVVQVVVPLRKTPSAANTREMGSSSGPPTRTGSKNAIASDAQGASSSSKRSRPSTSAVNASPPPTSSSLPLPATDGRAKRGAATKAASKLAQNASDMNAWEDEKKRAKLRGARDSTGKRRASEIYDVDLEEEVESQERERELKKRKVAKGREKKSQQEEEEEEEDAPVKSLARSKSKKNSQVEDDDEPPSKANRRDIRLLSTQVTLTEDVKATLAKIGVKITQLPAECTHVVAQGLVRTEKMLCAMANAPFILKEEWATKSAAQRKVLPEQDYLLVDPPNEKRYGVKLADAVARAQQCKRAGAGIFAGHTFYVSPKVGSEHKLLKTVISAHGGEFKTTPFTARILNTSPSRHAISSMDDRSLWSALAHDHTIYTSELILMSALKQELNLRDTSCILKGTKSPTPVANT